MNLAPVLSLFGHRAKDAQPVVRDWSQQELAQFYRVQWVLQQAGISIECDRGVSDEGDPWFVFCRATDSEVIVHIAREQGVYLLAGFVFGSVERGRHLDDVINRLLTNDALKPIQRREASNVIVHPATLLALIVSIAFFRQSEAAASSSLEPSAAADLAQPAKAQALPRPSTPASPAPIQSQSVSIEVNQALTLLRVVTVATNLAIGDVILGTRSASAADIDHQAADSSSHWDSETASVLQTGANIVDDSANKADSYRPDAAQLLRSSEATERFLETIALLWSKSGSASESQNGHDVGPGFIEPNATIERSPLASDKALSVPGSGTPVTGVASDVSVADSASALPVALSISLASATSNSLVKTALKLTLTGLNGLDLSVPSSGDISSLYSSLSEIVSRAKLPPAGGGEAVKLHAVLQEATDVTNQAVGKDSNAPEIAPSAPVDDSKPSESPALTVPFKTTSSGRATTHSVVDDGAFPYVERAIAAFKEDVHNFSMVINGDDVIFYSVDAVNSRSVDLVVELWQFEDGSSIGLVGLDHGNLLPYSL